MATDEQRLQQILKNLLRTRSSSRDEGTVSSRIAPAPPSTRFATTPSLDEETVIAFAVSDTGIGIPEDKLKLIFEAFQQADGTTSRSYGGTGLGLSISREIARLLGGEIQVESSAGKGIDVHALPAGEPPARPSPTGRSSASDDPLDARAAARPYSRESTSSPPSRCRQELRDDREEIEPATVSS